MVHSKTLTLPVSARLTGYRTYLFYILGVWKDKNTKTWVSVQWKCASKKHGTERPWVCKAG